MRGGEYDSVVDFASIRNVVVGNQNPRMYVFLKYTQINTVLSTRKISSDSVSQLPSLNASWCKFHHCADFP